MQIVLNTISFAPHWIIYFVDDGCETATGGVERDCELYEIFRKYVPTTKHVCRCRIESLFPDTNRFSSELVAAVIRISI